MKKLKKEFWIGLIVTTIMMGIIVSLMLNTRFDSRGKMILTKNSGELTCTLDKTDEDGYKINDTIIVTYKNSMVTKVVNINIAEMDSITLDMTLSFGTLFAAALNQIDGFQASYSKVDDNRIKYVTEVDYEKLDVEKLKEKFGKEFDEKTYYTQKNISLDEFKEKNLKDYECKS